MMMKDLLFKLSQKFTTQLPPLTPSEKKLTFIRSRKEIRKALEASMENDAVIGIYADAFGDGMFLCCVNELSQMHGVDVISLKPYDMNGILLNRNQLAITEIRCVCPIGSKYYNPILQEA